MDQNYVKEIEDLCAINKNLMEDLKILNENLKVLVPGAIEKENENYCNPSECCRRLQAS